MTNSRRPSLSASETEILRLLWDLHEPTVQQNHVIKRSVDDFLERLFEGE